MKWAGNITNKKNQSSRFAAGFSLMMQDDLVVREKIKLVAVNSGCGYKTEL